MAYSYNPTTTASAIVNAPAAGTPTTKGTTKGSGWGILGTILSVAAAVVIPFAAPAIAGAIFGTSVMAAWGGVAGVLASAGVGAALGGGVAAITGGDVVTGALGGALGGGVGQALGAGGMLAGALGGAGAAGGVAPAVSGGLTVGGAAATGVGAGAAGVGAAGGAGLAGGLSAGAGATGALGAAAGAPASGFFGNLFGKLPWDKLGNAALGAAPDLIGSFISDNTPISQDSQDTYNAIKAGLKSQEEAYANSKRTAQNLDPTYFAQSAANASRINSANTANQNIHDLALQGGTTDPSRVASEQRRSAVDGAARSGTAFNSAYLTALQAQLGAQQTAAGLRPNYGDYAAALADYSPEAVKKRRAAELSAGIAPWVAPFLKTNTTAQAGTG